MIYERPTDEEIAEWLMHTMRLFGASTVTQYRVTALFLDAINR